jgi:hypothetical protein
VAEVDRRLGQGLTHAKAKQQRDITNGFHGHSWGISWRRWPADEADSVDARYA